MAFLVYTVNAIMLSKKQTSFYWNLWSKICEVQGWKRSDSQRRYAFHRHCNVPRSMRNFNNSDFNRFISESAPFRRELDLRDRDRENAIYTLRELASTEYIQAVCLDLYDTKLFKDLPIEKLENLRNTIYNRSRKKNLKRQSTADCPF